MNTKLKAILYLIINLGVNGGIIAAVPADYKAIALLVFNCIQVVLAFLDPSYVLQKLGWDKARYLGAIENKKWGKEV